MRRPRVILAGLVAAVVCTTSCLVWDAVADSRRVIEYRYDAAGNLIGIESVLSQLPPRISAFDPPFARVGQVVRITASGTDLQNVRVTAADPAVLLGNLSSTPTSVSFDLRAGPAAAIGQSVLEFTTSLGSTTASLTIHPRLPVLAVGPSPLALGQGQAQALSVRLTGADVFPHVLSFTTGDTATATVTPSSITVSAGEVDAPLDVVVAGRSLGTTSLTISSPTLATFSTPVFVTQPFVSPPGKSSAFGAPIGVVKTRPPEPPVLRTRGPFAARVGVTRQADAVAAGNLPIELASPAVGLSKGSVLDGLTPDTVVIGTVALPLRAVGVGLDAVVGVEILPADGISAGRFAADPDGRGGRFALSVAADAATGQRQVVLREAPGARIPATNTGADRIVIAAGAPRVDSISPVVLTRATTSRTLIARGANLTQPSLVSVTPGTGLVMGAQARASADGRSIEFEVAVAPDAPLGPRVLSVATGAGSSATAASSANTLQIVNGPAPVLAPLTAPELGVVKGGASAPPPRRTDLRAVSLGVVRGTALTGLEPAGGVVGSSFTLLVRGRGLEGIDGVEMFPPEGVGTGVPVPAPDGTNVAIALSLDEPDAEPLVRRLRLTAGGNPVPAASPGADRFLVTLPAPNIDAISPNFLLLGVPPTQLRVFGENLGGTFSVSVEPPEDVSLGVPSVSAGGRSLSVAVSAAATAAPGARAVVVSTPAGTTSATAGPNNTLALGGSVERIVSPILAPLVGVQRGFDGATPTPVPNALHAPLVGVEREFGVAPVEAALGLEAPHLGVAVGPLGLRVQPSAVPIDSSVTLIIEGVGLQAVTFADFSPPTGILLDGPALASPDGRALTRRTLRAKSTFFSGCNRGSGSPIARRIILLTGRR